MSFRSVILIGSAAALAFVAGYTTSAFKNEAPPKSSPKQAGPISILPSKAAGPAEGLFTSDSFENLDPAELDALIAARPSYFVRLLLESDFGAPETQRVVEAFARAAPSVYLESLQDRASDNANIQFAFEWKRKEATHAVDWALKEANLGTKISNLLTSSGFRNMNLRQIESYFPVVDSMDAGPARERAVVGLYSALSRYYNAESMINLWHTSNQHTDGRLFSAFSNRLVDVCPSESLELLAALPPSPSVEFAQKDLFSKWIKKDPVNASEAIAGIEDPTFQQTAIKELVVYLFDKDPSAAEAWITTISDPKTRTAFFEELVRAEDRATNLEK